MKSFDQAASKYETFGFIQREMAAWLAEWLPTERCGIALEAGAGTGLFTRHLLPWDGRVVATDASPKMIDEGRSRCPQADWQTAPANHLPNVSADWIFSASFLQWADNPETLLKHWKKRLTPDGRILGGLFVAPTLPELYEVLPDSAPLHWHSPNQWDQFIQTSGLTLLRSESWERTFLFRSALELLRTLHGVGAAPICRGSAAKLRTAINDYDRRFASPEGVHSTWTFYRFEAK